MISSRNSGCFYVPMLKTKRSELDALKNIQNPMNVIPLLELHDLQRLDDSGKTTTFAQIIATAWPHATTPVFIDAGIAANIMAVGAFYTDLATQGMKIIPVTDPTRNQQYQNYVISIAQQCKNGICLRIPVNYFMNQQASAATLNNIISFLTQIKIDISNVYFLIDFYDIKISENAIPAMASWLMGEIRHILAVGTWKAVIMAGASYPQILPQSNTIYTIPRLEWMLWEELRSISNSTMVHFGDYTCHAAIHQDIPVFALANAACKLRYTTDSAWIAIKGESVKNSGAAQYYNLANLIAQRPEFCGPDFSFGDNYIYQRANKQGSSGGHQQWLTADINHHITYVMNQI